MHLKGSLVSPSSIQGFMYQEDLEKEDDFNQKYSWLKQKTGIYKTQIDPDKSDLSSPVISTEITEILKDKNVLKFKLNIRKNSFEFDQLLEELKTL